MELQEHSGVSSCLHSATRFEVSEGDEEKEEEEVMGSGQHLAPSLPQAHSPPLGGFYTPSNVPIVIQAATISPQHHYDAVDPWTGTFGISLKCVPLHMSARHQ